jgi:hypothetical protein
MFSKLIILSSIAFCLLTNAIFAQSNRPSMKSSTKKIDVKDGDVLKKAYWNLMPELKPDIYRVDGLEGKKMVTFYSDIDSITIAVERDKTYDFDIILNNKDTCWTRISAVPKFYFDEAYISQNKGKYTFEVPEVQELVHIIIALTPTGLKDSNMVEHEGKYYKKVIKTFEKYKSEPIVGLIDDFLQKGSWTYTVLKMDACGFYFDKDKIVKDKKYQTMSWGDENFAEPYISEIEKFAQKTNFRAFYKANLPLYKRQTKLLEVQTPIKQQWQWLEKNFEPRYDHYRITFSPLVSGSHSTNCLEQDNFKQIIMFICGPFINSTYNKKVQEALMTRTVFTEIDHNYVNPTSDKFRDEIDRSLQNLDKWAANYALQNYPDSYAVFNEYMTWAVFTLYAAQYFNKTDFETINNKVEHKMAQLRGFPRFKAFNRKLMELYNAKNKNENIADLYPQIIDWCKNQ